MGRDSFIFYRSFFEAINDLPEDNQLEIFRAIAEFSLDFKEPGLSGVSQTIFRLIRPNLEANNRKYVGGKKGGKHGIKGGRPKKENNPSITPPKPLDNPTGVLAKNPMRTPNDNVNVDVNVNVNENEDDNVNDNEDGYTHKKFIEKNAREKNATDFINCFEKLTGKKIKMISEGVLEKLTVLENAGYALEDFELVIKNCMSDPFHVERNFNMVTPDYVCSLDTFEKYCRKSPQSWTQEQVDYQENYIKGEV